MSQSYNRAMSANYSVLDKLLSARETADLKHQLTITVVLSERLQEASLAGTKIFRTRSQSLQIARLLARGGEHADSAAVMQALRNIGGIPEAFEWSEDSRFLGQLNALCAAARAGKAVSPAP